MGLSFNDLIPTAKNLVEKSTVHLGRSFQKDIAEEEPPLKISTETTILKIPLESELELELARVRYTQEEIEKTKQERQRKIELSNQMRSNAWSKRIKSKAYRKTKREEKQRKEAEKIKIELAVESENEEEINSENKRINPEIKTAEETAYNFLKTIVSPEPVEIIQKHTAKTTKKSIESVLELEDEEFRSEKITVQEEDKPWEKEEVLLGWNTWGGASVEPVMKSSNTKKIRRSGVEIRKRKDFAVSHVIYNEKTEKTRNPKYAVNQLPYGYKTLEEYTSLMDMPLSATHQPTTILNRLIKAEKEKRKHL